MSYEDTTAFLQQQATAALNDARNNASRIYSLPPNVNTRSPRFGVTLTKPKIGAPPVFSNMFQGLDNTDGEVARLDRQINDLTAKYFPAISGDLKTIPEDLLVGVISGVKPFGLDKTIFELVWHNARDRAYRTQASESRTLEATFSARGFSLPPGPLVDALAQSSERASDAILQVNREQAIKDAEIKLDLLKFAEEQALAYKTAIYARIAQFFSEYAKLPQLVVERERARSQAMVGLYNALSAYYGIEIAFEQLQLRAAAAKAGVDVDVDRLAIARQGNYSSTASALGSAVSGLASIAAQANLAGGSLVAEIANI